MPGIATLPAYFKEGYMSNFLGYVISIIISFVLAMVLTMIVGFKEDKEEAINSGMDLYTSKPINREGIIKALL